ncbi:bZIP transcription factor bZIP-1 [Penicillium vulpinum]|uniref:bZIP transcription factor bZIP-1 n=1 Tax=Penicillium vulpinum TaxID=29845 RepID=UPI0025495722|nr:bZIP transcription factor bZIP-1 [Penicillium vulpinum]KAJ5972223.1 bZIP transcription factor bZIP-1 [Penicillium vulpinum]
MDIISSTRTNPSLSSLPPSESPFGPLNFSIASRSSSSSNNFAPIDLTSFTTDYHQQPWLPSPPSQPLASNQNNNQNNNNNSALEDFVLYPSATPHPQPRLRVPVNTTHRPSALQPFLAQNNPRRHSFSLQLHRHLQQQFSGSPVQDPRVTQLARSPSYWSHPTFTHSRPTTASVPSNSPNTNRPPIPLFNGQQTQKHNAQTYRRVMSTPNFMEGNLPYVSPYPCEHIVNPIKAHEVDLFGLPSADFSASMDSPLSFNDLGLVNDFAAGPPGTISPKDLMMDASVPPSGTFTDLSTPSFESPGNFSQNTSPMFTDMDIAGHEEWPSLFDHSSDPLNAFDFATLDAAAAFSTEEKKPAMPLPVPMSPVSPRAKRSVASSPVPASGAVKHSSVAGVNARSRKNLSPVEFDPSDPIAAKRARNTEAARKSRAKKMERQFTSERRIADLEKIIAERDAEIAKLKAQLQIQNTYQ